jgi:hypothetical protein
VLDASLASALASDPRFDLTAVGEVPLEGFGSVPLTRISPAAASRP